MEIGKLLKDKRMLFMLAVVAVALALAAVRGVHFGLEFAGGTRIPVTLEKSVNQVVMDDMINNIKNRVSAFGLTQVVVKAIGESEIYIDLPQSDPGLVNHTLKILERQGNFEGIVDGRVAVTDKMIMPGSIRESTPSTGGRVSWEVDFAITEDGARTFSEVVRGKADYPLYMYLDRPNDSIVLLTRSELLGNTTMTEMEALSVARDVLRREDSTIPVLLINDWNSTRAQLESFNTTQYPKVIVSNETDARTLAEITALGFNLTLKNETELSPRYLTQQTGTRVLINEWRAVGLLTAPILSGAITQGSAGRFYSISGGVDQSVPVADRQTVAAAEVKELKSVLSGGALPVHVIVGTPTTIPAPLGAEFLKYSIVAALAAVVAMVAIISLRYKNLGLVPLIFITSFSELIILVCVLGSLGTIDLASMAGIIGAIGTGVNAQIVITDELLSSGTQHVKKKMGNAFYIIFTNATIAVVAMVPLLFFSGLVEIVGFAMSTILGMFIGAFITRPAYGVMVEDVILTDAPRRI